MAYHLLETTSSQWVNDWYFRYIIDTVKILIATSKSTEIIREHYDPIKPNESQVLAQVIQAFVMQGKLAQISVSSAVRRPGLPENLWVPSWDGLGGGWGWLGLATLHSSQVPGSSSYPSMPFCTMVSSTLTALLTKIRMPALGWSRFAEG